MKKGMLLCVLLNLIHLLFPANERMVFQHLSFKDGLSQNTIHCIFQDSKGFMWFGTRGGLNRYDGYTFKKYYHDPKNRDSLSDNNILTIYEDREGLLWIGTHRGGVNIFNRQRETFTRFMMDPTDPTGLGSNDIQVIAADKAGVIWIATWDKGLHKYDRQNRKIIRYIPGPDNPHSFGHQKITSLCVGRNGDFWIGTGGSGLKRFDPEKQVFTNHYIADAADPNSLTGNDISFVCEDHWGDIWAGTFVQGLNRLDPKTGKITRYINDPADPSSLCHDFIGSIFETRDRDLWIGSWEGGGLGKFHRKENKFSCFKSNPDDPFSLSQDNIDSIYESRSGILWIGTFNKGINKYIPEKKEFLHYQKGTAPPTHKEHNCLSHNVVSTIYEDQVGMLWIGTWGGGLNLLDQKREKITYYNYTANNPKRLGNPFVTDICQDRTGKLWVATGAWLYTFNREKQEFTPFQPPKAQLQDEVPRFILTVTEDHQGLIWIGTKNSGLYAYNPENEHINRYVNDPLIPETLSHNEIITLYETRSGTLWIGTSGGLNRFERETGRFIRYLTRPENPKSISHNYILCLCEDHKGTLWIGTHGGGLNKLVKPGIDDTFIHYSLEQGLPHNVVHGILEDNMGYLWISTNQGLSRFDPVTETFINYTKKDGLQGEEFTGAVYKSRSGEMFFGGTNGFNAFFPGNIKKNLYVPPIVITAIKVFRSADDVYQENHTANSAKTDNTSVPRFFKEIFDKEEIVLPYKENTFSIQFAALDYTEPGENQYAYTMQELDKHWNYIGNKREAIFVDLSPGEYTFRVKGSNNSGVWNEKGLTRTIKILSPPLSWETLLLLLLISLPVIVTIFFLLFFKLKQHKRSGQEEETDIDIDGFFAGYDFTNREKEIIKLLLQGKSKKEIEEELFISPHTVKNNIYNIYQKLGIKNRLQIIKLIQKK